MTDHAEELAREATEEADMGDAQPGFDVAPDWADRAAERVRKECIRSSGYTYLGQEAAAILRAEAAVAQAQREQDVKRLVEACKTAKEALVLLRHRVGPAPLGEGQVSKRGPKFAVGQRIYIAHHYDVEDRMFRVVGVYERRASAEQRISRLGAGMVHSLRLNKAVRLLVRPLTLRECGRKRGSSNEAR